MRKFKYTEFEKRMNPVLKYHDEALADIHFPSSDETDATIARTEACFGVLDTNRKRLKSWSLFSNRKKSWLFLLGKNCVPRQ